MTNPNASSPRRTPRAASRRGLTLVEAMTVVAIIAVLVGILVPALGLVRNQAKLVTSQSNLRTIGALMTAYSLDNRDYVLPSQFDDSANPFSKGLVRTASPAGTSPNIGPLRKGSWTDILWTVNKMGPIVLNDLQDTQVPSPTWDYRYDSPDYYAYVASDSIEKNPFRSTVEMKKPLKSTDDISASLPRPFGPGASSTEAGQLGYFAANDFFDATPASGSPAGTQGNWYTNATIRRPNQSMYLVDSRAGETIPLLDASWKPDTADCEIDFRYVGDSCAMLFMDGHVTTEGKWTDLNDLERSRQIRVRALDQR